MRYYHVDVFSQSPMSGNGLTVVFAEKDLSDAEMLAITKEFRQFETAFIQNTDGVFSARIFTLDEELDFAGHPLLGSAAVIHSRFFSSEKIVPISVQLRSRVVMLVSECRDAHYYVTMDQGQASFLQTFPPEKHSELAQYINLSADDFDSRYPVEIISTGLPYLIIPVSKNLYHAEIIRSGLEKFIRQFGAKFIYLTDLASRECRTWDNSGNFEDAATGSAAGPLYYYLVRHGLALGGEKVELRQGVAINRPSIITAWSKEILGVPHIFIGGPVSFFACGEVL